MPAEDLKGRSDAAPLPLDLNAEKVQAVMLPITDGNGKIIGYIPLAFDEVGGKAVLHVKIIP